MVTPYAEYLQSILSSKLYEFAYKKMFSSVEIGAQGYQYNKHALIKLPVIFDAVLITQSFNDQEIYRLYSLTKEEILYIENPESFN